MLVQSPPSLPIIALYSSVNVCAGSSPLCLHLPLPPYITLHVAARGGAKGNTIMCHLNVSFESAEDIDITSKMTALSNSIRPFECLHTGEY